MSDEIQILYVEDEPSIAKLLASGLDLFGISVKPIYMSAEALIQAWDQPEIQRADLLIFDIRLPGMTGLELATKLRGQGEKRPLVLVSAWPRPDQSELAAIQAEFIAKPFDFSDVVQTIQKLVNRS